MAVEENRNSSTQDLFELGEGEDEVPWKRVYARATVKATDKEGQTNKREDALIIDFIRTPPTFIRTCTDECGNPIP